MNLSRFLWAAIPVGRTWVRSQHKRFRFSEGSRPLAASETARLSPFFSLSVLNKVKIVEVAVIPNPWFYPLLRFLRIDVPLDMSHAGAITFDDTVIISRDSNRPVLDWYPLLFHELVHVVQYQLFGLDDFIDRYMRAAIVMDYDQNPLEREAFTLERHSRPMRLGCTRSRKSSAVSMQRGCSEGMGSQ